MVRNREHLNDKRNQKQRLPEALHINQPPVSAHCMKEELGLVWKQPNKQSADSFLKEWVARAQVSRVRMLRNLAQTFAPHRAAILALYDYPIATAPMEATKNKIKTMQYKVYGCRSLEFFTLKIYASRNMKYAPVG